MASELLEAALGTEAVAGLTSDAAILNALCAVETALARACSSVGLIPLPVALEVGVACDAVRADGPDALRPGTLADGNPVVGLVKEIRARVDARAGADAARAVHLGATSQDILDTALMIVAGEALDVITTELGACGDITAALARTHRATPMSGRTLLQQAVPTTFGALAAVWGSGLDRARTRLAAVRSSLPASLGGAAGTLAPLHPHGLAVLAAFAEELGLAEPDGVWHTERTAITELAGALGSAAAAVGKAALDIVLLSQTEIGELRERAPGSSSAMPHKNNPIASLTARAAAAQTPGLVATLLAAGSQELQRGAGTWHAEWPALLSLLRCTGGAVARLRVALDLDVDAAAMLANLAQLAGTVDTADLGHATDLVDRYLERRRR